MARALIVGCGCRGRGLGAALAGQGWAVRGTSREPDRLQAIGAAGIEPALADPAAVATVFDHVADATVVAWLMGSAGGEPGLVEAIHGPRLERLLEKLVDTPVRGFVYEAEGSVARPILEGGAALVRAASQRWRIPVQVVGEAPDDPIAWGEAMVAAVRRLVA